jgi:MFS family permease
LTGAILLARRPNIRGLTRWLLVTASLSALGTIGFSLSRTEWISFICIGIAGMGLMGTSASVNTIVQTIVDDKMRGRVVSIYSTFFIGSAPLGHLAAGWLAEHIGAPRAFTVCGIGCATATLVYWLYLPKLRIHLRPIYEKKGIIPAPTGSPEK